MLCIMLHITQECHGFVQLGQEVTTQNCLIIKQKIWAIVQCNLKFMNTLHTTIQRQNENTTSNLPKG